jgi:hypothetical protein
MRGEHAVKIDGCSLADAAFSHNECRDGEEGDKPERRRCEIVLHTSPYAASC